MSFFKHTIQCVLVAPQMGMAITRVNVGTFASLRKETPQPLDITPYFPIPLSPSQSLIFLYVYICLF